MYNRSSRTTRMQHVRRAPPILSVFTVTCARLDPVGIDKACVTAGCVRSSSNLFVFVGHHAQQTCVDACMHASSPERSIT